MGRERLRRALAIAGFPAAIAAVALAAFAFRAQLLGLFRSSEAIRDAVAATGSWAPLAFVGLQAVQVIVFFIPGEVVQIAGGFAFGLWGGTLWSVAGILLGSLVNFGVGRLLGRPFAAAVLKPERLARVEASTAGGKAVAGFLLLFAIPGIPKDALTYAAGASGLSFWAFIVVSTMGRLPGILGSAYMGSAVFDREYGAAIAVLSVALVALFLGFAFRERLHDLVDRLISRLSGPRR